MRNYSSIHKCYSQHTEMIVDGTKKIFSNLTNCPKNCSFKYLCLKYNLIDQTDARMINDVREAIKCK